MDSALAYFAYWTSSLVDGSRRWIVHCLRQEVGDAAAYQSALFDGCIVAIAASRDDADQCAGQGIRGRFSGKLEGISVRAEEQAALREFRDAMLNWI